ncbi:MAG: hypothetical protein KDD02_14490 [Phaeodactylibacter sp.]|nr:hypothetical protein [Phaeodactylibacter sp.]MCB9302670.1 hypothetical protein [Lewinellaceae bacterium]
MATARKHSDFIRTLQGLLDQSPTLLLVSMGLGFLITFFVQAFFYGFNIFADVVPKAAISLAVGVAIGLLTQITRFSFGISGAHDFAKGRIGKGVFGLFFSVAVTAIESFEMTHVAHAWGAGNPFLEMVINMILQFVIWVSFILEVRLVITVARSLSDVQEEEALQRDGQTAAPTPQESHLLVLENAILELGKQQLAILEELKQGRKPAPDPELELSLNGNGQHSGN